MILRCIPKPTTYHQALQWRGNNLEDISKFCGYEKLIEVDEIANSLRITIDGIRVPVKLWNWIVCRYNFREFRIVDHLRFIKEYEVISG